MAQETHSHISEPSSTECGDFDIADEIEWACTRLQDTMRDETAAYESLESLFKKRREDAAEAVRKAQSHLHFVNEEEDRLRKKLRGRSQLGAKSGSNGNKHAGSAKKNPYSERATKSSNPQESPAVGLVFSQVSSLNSYLDISEFRQKNDIKLRKEAEKKLVALRQLIAKYETPTRPVHARFIDGPEVLIKESLTNPNRLAVDEPVKPVTEVPSIGDVSVLRERLEEEERMLAYYDDAIQKQETEMAAYRRFIAAETT